MSTNGVQQAQVKVSALKQGRCRWLPYLTLVMLIELVLVLRFLPNEPLIMRRIRAWQGSRHEAQRLQRLRRLMRNDIRIGHKVPLVSLKPGHNLQDDKAVEELTYQRPNLSTIIVFVGSCTSCITEELKEWETIQKEQRDLRILIVSRDSAERISQFLELYRLNLPIVSDSQGQ